jgi:hypothetical protein
MRPSVPLPALGYLAATVALVAGASACRATPPLGVDRLGSGGSSSACPGAPPDPGTGTPTDTYPASHPVAPKVVSMGGPVLAAPRVSPVFFSGDDATVTGPLTTFVDGLGTLAIDGTPYWAAATSEYGVGPLTALAAVELTETAPAAIADSALKVWLAGLLDADDPALPTPDDDTLIALFYPASTTVTLDIPGSPDEVGCTDIGGYHSSTVLDAAHGKRNVAYAVLPRCPDLAPDVPVLDMTTFFASHELIEASTDPYPLVTPAYLLEDTGHLDWALAVGGGEVADMCAAWLSSIVLTPSGDPFVQRSWSNAAAAAGHDPCVPAPAGEVYFNSVPVLPDTIMLPTTPPAEVVGVRIPVGMTKTIDVDLFSDGETIGPWSVAAQQLPLAVGTKSPSTLTLCLDASAGSNGQTLHLTLTVSPEATEGFELFELTSTLGDQVTYWYGLVGN